MMFKDVAILYLLVAQVNGFTSHLNLARTIDRSNAHAGIAKAVTDDILPTSPATEVELEKDSIRAQIEEMREEAITRLEVLNKQVQVYREEETRDNEAQKEHTLVVDKDAHASTAEADLAIVEELDAQKEELDSKSMILSGGDNTRSQRSESDRLRLLDDTAWKVTLNIGREQGTWMPQAWGESGERLLLNLKVNFSPEQLYEREDFLNGMPGANTLQVLDDNTLTIGPTITQSSRKIRVKDGGWRISPGEGPAGTDLLRFYVELEEEAKHQGSDVYCPKGRVYCTCGYFSMDDRQLNLKDSIRADQEELRKRYDRLQQENDEDTSFFSMDKIKRSKQLLDMRVMSQDLNERMNKARIREPEKNLLRTSMDQKVSLTKEGGVCIKVSKGLAFEYHILGKFGVACSENVLVTDTKQETSKSSTLQP